MARGKLYRSIERTEFREITRDGHRGASINQPPFARGSVSLLFPARSALAAPLRPNAGLRTHCTHTTHTHSRFTSLRRASREARVVSDEVERRVAYDRRRVLMFV